MIIEGAEPTRILIVGGGFAGMSALFRLETLLGSRQDVDIKLISRDNFFLFTPLLSEVAMGTVDPRHIVTPIREVCRKTLFHRAEILELDLDRQWVEVRYNGMDDCKELISYDHLVLALGSTTNMSLVPGVEQYAYNFKALGDALVLRNHILEMFERADTALSRVQKQGILTFCVIGGGYSGVEIAAAIQDMTLRIEPLYPTITPADIRVLLVETGAEILSTMPDDLAQYAHRQLEAQGVEVMLNTKAAEVQPDGLFLQPGERIHTHTVVWATGVTIPPLIMGLPVLKDVKGRPLSTSVLHLPEYPNVWAIGDNVLIPCPDAEGYYPPTAQNAIRQGRHAAENICRVLQGKPPQTFRYQVKGEMVVLGERSAVAMVFGRKIKGFPAWLLWRSYYLSILPRWKKKVRVAMDWVLTLFGPLETTELKVYAREEPCDTEGAACDRRDLPGGSRTSL
jgi:NADH:ubiquinone reductase (H+-translocating)